MKIAHFFLFLVICNDCTHRVGFHEATVQIWYENLTINMLPVLDSYLNNLGLEE